MTEVRSRMTGERARGKRERYAATNSPNLHTHPPNINNLTPPSSPTPKPVPIISPFRHGYTGRRAGEAGPALVMEKRRKSSSSGFAENGLPPATRGEAKGYGPALHLLMPERARRACLCGTHGGR